MTTMQAAHRTIGTDKGYGDIFSAHVRYEDGAEGLITIYGGNLQGAGHLLQMFKPIWNFTTLRLS